MDLTIIPTDETIKEKISLQSLKDKPKIKQEEYEAPKLELSKNIQKFDRKPKVYTENPYSFNAVSLKPKTSTIPTATAEQMITNPTYNIIGKFLGVDTVHDWNKCYDKVYAIAEWAKLKSGLNETNSLLRWISSKSKTIPNMGTRNIDNLYLFARLYLSKKEAH